MSNKTKNNTNLKKAENDWFKILDKNNTNIHYKYKNLDKDKIAISKETYVLSLIEYSNDQKKFNMIKEQMEQNEQIERDKLENENNNKTRNKKKRKDFIFPNLNIKNYKYTKPQTSIITNPENEAIQSLLGKFDKQYHKRLRDKFIHKKVYPKGFNLSKSNFLGLTNYKTIYTENNDNNISNRSLNKYQHPNIYFKYSLNDGLLKVYQDISKEENILLKTSNDLMKDVKNSKIEKKNKDKQLNIHNFRKKIYGNYRSDPFIDKMYFKGKKNFFNETKEKMFNVYLKKKNDTTGQEIKLVSSRRNSEDLEN